MGGGIYNANNSGVYAIGINASTIANNTAGSGGGGIHTDVEPGNTRVELLGSILAGNTSGGGALNVVGTVRSLGYNVSDDTSAELGAEGDLQNVAVGLAPLATNPPGGPPTHAIQLGSPAIDRIPTALCVAGYQSINLPATDERGVPRPQGPACDSGAYEAPCASPFVDVSSDHVACTAIVALTSAQIINGYDTNPPTFGPDDPVQRAQMAAFLVRALGWQGAPTGPRTFNDFGGLVGELRTASLILANACADPNNSATCVAQGYGDGRFGPNDQVTHAQVITFIARAFGLDPQYAWQAQPGGAQPYSGVPTAHDVDIRTYFFYAGDIADAPTTPDGWNSPAPREWVARVLYQALQAQPLPPE